MTTITADEYTPTLIFSSVRDYGENFFDSSGNYRLTQNISDYSILSGYISVINATVTQWNQICYYNAKGDFLNSNPHLNNVVDYGSSFVNSTNTVIPFDSKAEKNISRLSTIKINKISVAGFKNYVTYLTDVVASFSSKLINTIIYDTAANINADASYLLTHTDKIEAIVNSDGGVVTLDASLASKLKIKYTSDMVLSEFAANTNNIFYYEDASTLSAAMLDSLTQNSDKIYKIMFTIPGSVTMTGYQAGRLIEKMLDKKSVNVSDFPAYATAVFSAFFEVIITLNTTTPVTMTSIQAYNLCKLLPVSSCDIVDSYSNFMTKYLGDSSIRFRLSENIAKINNFFLSSIVDSAANLDPLLNVFSSKLQDASVVVGSSVLPETDLIPYLGTLILYISKIIKIWATGTQIVTYSLAQKLDGASYNIFDAFSNYSADKPIVTNGLFYGNVADANNYLAANVPFISNFVIVDSHANIVARNINNTIKLGVDVSSLTVQQRDEFLLSNNSNLLFAYNSSTVWISSLNANYELVVDQFIGNRNVIFGSAVYPLNLRDSRFLFNKLALTPSKITNIYSNYVTYLTRDQYLTLTDKFNDGKVSVGSPEVAVSFSSIEKNLTHFINYSSKIVSVYPSIYLDVTTFDHVNALAGKVPDNMINLTAVASIIQTNLDAFIPFVSKLYRFSGLNATGVTMTTLEQTVLASKFPILALSLGTSSTPVAGIESYVASLATNAAKFTAIWPSENITMSAAQANSLAAKFPANKIIVNSSGVEIQTYLTALANNASRFYNVVTTDFITMTVSQAFALSSKFTNDGKIRIVDTNTNLTSSVLSGYELDLKINSVTVSDTVANLTDFTKFDGLSKVSIIVNGTSATLTDSVLAGYRNSDKIRIILADTFTNVSAIPSSRSTTFTDFLKDNPNLSITVGSPTIPTPVAKENVADLIAIKAYITMIYPTSTVDMSAADFVSIGSKFADGKTIIGTTAATDPDIATNIDFFITNKSKINAIRANTGTLIRIAASKVGDIASKFAGRYLSVGSQETPVDVQQYSSAIFDNHTKIAAVYPSDVATAFSITSALAVFPDNSVEMGRSTDKITNVQAILTSLMTYASKITKIYSTDTIYLTAAQALVLASKFPDGNITIGSMSQSQAISTSNLDSFVTNASKFVYFFPSSIVTMTSVSHVSLAPKFFDDNMLSLGSTNSPVSGVQTILESLRLNASKFTSIYPDEVVTLTAEEAEALATKIPPNKRLTLNTSNICFPKGTKVVTDQGILEIQHISNGNTFAGYAVQAVTQTVTADDHLIEFSAGAFAPNVPSNTVRMSKDHAIFWNGKMKKAKDYTEGRKVQYNGQVLYNVLLDVHGLMNVEGLACETLHPSNSVAKYHRATVKQSVEEWNKYVVENKVFA